MDTYIVFFLNMFLIIIITFNIILSTLNTKESKEYFTNSQIKTSDLRKCKLYLLEDEEMCDKLEKIYKLSNMQIDIALYKLKDKNKNSYDLLKYVQDNKKDLNVNACKIELSHLKEVNSSNYMNITKPFNYNLDTLSGYCLANTDIQKASNIKIMNDYTKQLETYEPVKIVSDISTLIKQPEICSFNKYDIDNGLKFLKLYCNLDKSKDVYKIIVNKIDFVSYQNGNFIVQDDSYNMKDFFKYNYNSRQIMYQPRNMTVSLYTLTFNSCNKLDDFLITNSISFSFSELNILPKIIVYNINISPYNIDENSYDSQIMKKKSDEILSEIKKIDIDISKYEEDMDNNKKTYDEKDAECSKNTDKKLCTAELETLKNTSEILKKEKQNKIDEKNKLNNTYNIFQNQRQIFIDDNATITSIINKKINDISEKINSLNIQIKQYDNYIQENMKTYKSKQAICETNIDKKEENQKCYSDLNAILQENNTLEEEKIYLKDMLNKLNEEYSIFIDKQQKFRNVKYTLKELNEMINLGVVIDFDKYSEYLSNDNCIYIQFL